MISSSGTTRAPAIASAAANARDREHARRAASSCAPQARLTAHAAIGIDDLSHRRSPTGRRLRSTHAAVGPALAAEAPAVRRDALARRGERRLGGVPSASGPRISSSSASASGSAGRSWTGPCAASASSACWTMR